MKVDLQDKTKKKSKLDLKSYERKLYLQGYNLIVGCDEAGRGPLFGPVVASAVILPKDYELEGLNDSKQLTEKQRNKFYDILNKEAISIGIGIVDSKVIDEINILEASRLAMNIAIDNLSVKPDYILTDAMKLNRDVPVMPIIHGDALSISIAAASVIAKVTRDRLMEDASLKHPEYEFAKHKGYPTKRHIELIQKFGIIDGYRKTFKPVKDVIEKRSSK